MNKNNLRLVDAIEQEIERVWGGFGPYKNYVRSAIAIADARHFPGDAESYAWLELQSGITEGEDVQWQFIFEKWHDLLSVDEDDGEEQDLLEFLNDDVAVHELLESFLERYRSITTSYYAK